MNFLQKIKDSPHYSRLKNSVQYRYDRRQFLIIGCFMGFVLLMMCLVTVMLMQMDNPAVVLVVFYMLFLVGLILAFAYRWLEIFLHINSYIFFQARLDRPFVKGRGGVGFTVTFTDRHGNSLERKTSPMFSSQWDPILEEYNNQTVLLGYNEETDRLVLIGRV